jgi:hypothetical protein
MLIHSASIAWALPVICLYSVQALGVQGWMRQTKIPFFIGAGILVAKQMINKVI